MCRSPSPGRSLDQPTTLPIITKRATALKTLLDKQLGSEQEYLQLEQQRIEAEIKVHICPFTKYGVIEAEVLNVSSDAIATEQ